MRTIVIIAHDIRSTHNIGALLRTADGLGINHVYLTGYSPYPKKSSDTRLPYIADKLEKQINKTALGAQHSVAWTHSEDIHEVITQLRKDSYNVIGLEQTDNSIALPSYQPNQKVAILLGREVEGIDPQLCKLCDATIEIPMSGKKESFNVVEAATMAMYHTRYFPFDLQK